MMTKKERALFAVQKLKEKYPDAVCSLQYQKPYELLIATRLSAQCTDARVNIVTKELFQKFPTLQSFADANIADIEAVVKPCGLYKTKAKSKGIIFNFIFMTILFCKKYKEEENKLIFTDFSFIILLNR